MATTLTKSDPDKLAFRLNQPDSPVILQVAQDFSVTVDVQFGGLEHAAYREDEFGVLVVPSPETWVPGARFVVLANRAGATTARGLMAVPAADADHHLGLPIGGFTIGEDGYADPATAWDLSLGERSVQVAA